MNLLLFLILSMLWGGSFIAIGSVVLSLPPLLAGALRVASALIFLLLLAPIIRKKVSLPRSALPLVWLTGLLAQGIPFALLFWAEQRISPGLAGIFNGTVPIWTFVLGSFFLPASEPPSRRRLLGVLIGLLGVSFIFVPKITHPQGTPALLGTLAVWGMAAFYSSATLMNRALLSAPPERRIPLYASNFHQSLSALLFLGVLSFALESWPDPRQLQDPLRILGSTIYLGWLSTGLGFLIYFRLIRAWGAVRASTVTYLVPIIALGLDFLINRNTPSSTELIGSLTIFAGVGITQKRTAPR